MRCAVTCPLSKQPWLPCIVIILFSFLEVCVSSAQNLAAMFIAAIWRPILTACSLPWIFTLQVIIIPGWPKCAEKYSAPSGSTENEIEQFRHMEMVGVIISKKWFSGMKIEKCKHFLQAAGFGTSMGFHPPGSVAQTSRIHPLAQISQFHLPGSIMTCRVCFEGRFRLFSQARTCIHAYMQTCGQFEGPPMVLI